MTIVQEFKLELEQVYAWRLKFCKQRLGGNLSQEFRSLDYLANWDEMHMPLLPEDESEYWHHAGYTLGLMTFASDRVRPAPMIIDKGVLQGKVPNPIMVELDGKLYPVYRFQYRGSEESLVAKRIIREYWGPARGHQKYTQRLFRVEFSDGSTEILVAEDLVDSLPGEAFEQNDFYAEVLRAWRTEHTAPPDRPNTA